MSQSLILVVKDDDDIADIVLAYLKRNSFRTAADRDTEPRYAATLTL